MKSDNPVRLEDILAEESWLRSLSRQLVRDPDAAADLAQETWLAALKAPAISTPRAWLRTVARRIARRNGRAERARAIREQDASRREGVPDTAEAVAHAENLKALVEAALALEEPFRETVLLRYFEEMQPREIALKMDVQAATVRSRLTRAHAKLRELLTGEAEVTEPHSAGWLAALADWGHDSSNGWKLSWQVTLAGASLIVAGGLLAVLQFHGMEGGVGDTGLAPELPRVVEREFAVDASDALSARLADSQHGKASARSESNVANLGATVTGNILAPDGSPVANALLVIRASKAGRASVQLHGAGNEPGERLPGVELQLRSSAKGEFEIPREYVSERKDRRSPVSYFISHESLRFCKVSQAVEFGVPIELRPLWKVQLRGIVRDAATGATLRGVQVFYGPDALETVTDGEGRFQLDGLPGYQGRVTRLYHADYVFQATGTPLVGPTPALQEFRMERGLELNLSFVDSDSGVGVPGVRVFFDDSVAAFGTADFSGALRVRVSGGGLQILRGECAGYANFEWRFSSDTVQPGKSLRIPVEVLARVGGKVTDSHGLPLGGARVASWPGETPAGFQSPGLPGRLLHTLRTVRGWEPPLDTDRTDSGGLFSVNVLKSQGPWKISASQSGRVRAEVPFDCLGSELTLVLERTAVSQGLSLKGQLVRDGKPWVGEAPLTLTGPRTSWSRGGLGGNFEFTAFASGTYQLTWAGKCLREIYLDGGVPALNVGEVDLGSLPSLRVRFETLAGDAIPRADVQISALVPPAAAPIGGQGVPISQVRGQTDSAGDFSTLLPLTGEYSVGIATPTVRHRETIRVDGDDEFVIRVPARRKVYLRLKHAQTQELLGALKNERWMVDRQRSAGEGYDLVNAHTRSDGLLELSCSAGPTNLRLRPFSSGFRSVEISEARLAGNSMATPTDVFLNPGLALELIFEERLSEKLGEGVELFLVRTSELALVRAGLSHEQLTRLAARGQSVRFLDPLLAALSVLPPPGALSVELSCLSPGPHTIVAFEGATRRTDLQFEPAKIDVQPGFNVVRLRLRD